MSMILTIDNMLEAAQDCEHPDYEKLVAMMEEAASKLAHALADHLGIVVKFEATWEGSALEGICASFGPKEEGDPCPDVIRQGDEGGEWTVIPTQELNTKFPEIATNSFPGQTWKLKYVTDHWELLVGATDCYLIKPVGDSYDFINVLQKLQ